MASRALLYIQGASGEFTLVSEEMRLDTSVPKRRGSNISKTTVCVLRHGTQVCT